MHAAANMAVVPHMKWHVHLEWKVDVDRAGKKRHHAEREPHYEAEEIKIRPGHTAPRAHPARERDSGRRPNPNSRTAADALDPAARFFRRQLQAATLRPSGPPNLAYEEFHPTTTGRAANRPLPQSPTALRSAPDRPQTARRRQTTT